MPSSDPGREGDGSPPEHLELVARRSDVLDRLTEGPTEKRDLADELEPSRSTVDRAVRALEDADLVERVRGGYRTTLAGRLSLRRYRRHVADQRAIGAASHALAALPGDADPPTPLVTGGTVHDDADPVDLFRLVADRLVAADRYRLLLPVVGDSRHLRLCHARAVRDGLEADLALDPAVVERVNAEFPRLAAGLDDATTVTARQTETPAFGLALAADGDRRWAALLVYDGGDLHAVLESEAAPAVRAVRRRLDAVDERATPAETLASAESPVAADLLDGAALRDAGFRRVDRGYFARRTPNDPASAWRVGFALADVYYGYALDRVVDPGWPDDDRAAATPPEDPVVSDPGDDAGEDREETDGNADDLADLVADLRDDTRPSADAVLADRLAAGSDVAVLGPSGAGKSTLCRAVTCRWVQREAGVALHRVGDAGALDSLGPVVDAVEADDGHTLVVVEDAGDADTLERVLELRRRCRGRDDLRVSVLVEARESDWDDAQSTLPARLREVCRTDLTTVEPPAVDRRTCERAIASFEAATGRSVSLSPADLHEAVETESGAGAMYLLGHRLATHTDPDPWGERPPSSLDDDVRDALDALDDADDADRALAMGVLVAVLTAAERPVTDGLLHALAAGADGDDDGDTPAADHRPVERARSELVGLLLFPGDDGYRTHHPEWALRFLEVALDRHERRTVAAFERALDAVAGLADEPERRDRIAEWLGRETPAVDRLGTPEGVETLLTDVFDLVTRRAALAPLLGTSERSGVALPAAAPETTRLELVASRAVAAYGRGEYERAVEEAEHLVGRAEAADAPEDERARYLVRGHHQAGHLLADQGEHDRARDHLQEGLAAAERRRRVSEDDGAVRDEVKIRNTLGWLEMETGDLDAADRQLSAARSAGDDLGVVPERSATLYFLGDLAERRGDLAAAEEHLAASLEIDRQCPSMAPTDEAATLNGLGRVAMDRDQPERAERRYRESLAIEREAGTERGRMVSLVGLGRSLADQGEHDAATEALEAALSAAADLEMPAARSRALRELGRVDRLRGAYDAAGDRLTRARQVALEAGEDGAVGLADRALAALARDRDDPVRAADRYERAQRRLREHGADREALEALEALVDLHANRGDRAAAAEWCERAVEVADEIGLEERCESLTERRTDLASADAGDD